MTTRYRRPDLVGFTASSDDDWPSAYLAVLPAGPIHWLDPTGYLIWSTAVDRGDERDIVAEVARVSGEMPERIAADVTAFLAELVHIDLLET
jgi:hypothetical protein